MVDLFHMEKKGKYEKHSGVLKRVEDRIDQVQQKGKLRLSWEGMISSVTVALLNQAGQLLCMREEDELNDKGTPATRKMTRWMTDNAPGIGRRLAILRNNEHESSMHTWHPWHTEQFRIMLELLNSEVKFAKTN